MGLERLISRTSKKTDIMYIPEAAPIQWRHEWKYELDISQAATIRSRIQAIAEPDPHAGKDGRYLIRSLYFDNYRKDTLQRNLSGVGPREKFRLRFYNGDMSFIRLEKKVKRNNLGTKYEERVSKAEVYRILSGNLGWLPGKQQDDGNGEQTQRCSIEEEEREALEHPLLLELYSKMRMSNLEPMVIVEYLREPFCFDAGNVRITFDYDLRVGLEVEEFLNPYYQPLSAAHPFGRYQAFEDCSFGWDEVKRDARNNPTWMMNQKYAEPIMSLRGSVTGTENVLAEFLPVSLGPIILEVKWDNFLPNIIQDIIQMPGLPVQAFSKYVRCSAFG